MSTITHGAESQSVRTGRVGMPFPPDKRERVTQTTQAPWSATGLVTATFPDHTVGEATGFAIGDRYVVTAAHSVYETDFEGEATSVSFQPARNGDAVPFNTFKATAWHFPAAYATKELAQDDYCLLVLAAPLPSQVFRYQLTAASDETLRKNEYQIAGYPDDKQPYNSMWYDAGMLTSVEKLLLQYRISTSGGQSGAAVASYLDTTSTAAVGIHCRVNSGKTANLAVRVTDAVIAQIEAWKRK